MEQVIPQCYPLYVVARGISADGKPYAQDQELVIGWKIPTTGSPCPIGERSGPILGKCWTGRVEQIDSAGRMELWFQAAREIGHELDGTCTDPDCKRSECLAAR